MDRDDHLVFLLRMLLATTVLILGVVVATWPAAMTAGAPGSPTILGGAVLSALAAVRLVRLLRS